MIVRIVGEGQYRLDDELIQELNRHDTALMAALAGDDFGGFREVLAAMADLVHQRGQPVDDTEFVQSDAILPPEDATPEEVSALLGHDGLVPG